jgi:periplasmic copper chaperone A
VSHRDDQSHVDGSGARTCDEWQEILSASLDGVAVDDDAALDAHVSGCEPCSRFRSQAERLHRMVRLRPAEAVPDGHASIMAAVDPALHGLHLGRRRRALLTSLAAVALVAVLAAGAIAGVRGLTGDGSGPARIMVGEAYLTPAPANGVSTLWVSLRNEGEADDALVDVRTAAADRADLHAVRDDEGQVLMRSVDEFPLVSGRERLLGADASHVMLLDTTTELVPGQEVDVELRFAGSPARTVTAVVLAPGEDPPA